MMPPASVPRNDEAIRVLVNRASGRGKAGRLAPRIEDFFRHRGIRARFFWPESASALQRLAAEAAAQECRRLVVVGGDGTLLEAINGAFGSGIELGVIPAGDANDVAASLGLPRDPFAAAELLGEWVTRPIDLVKARFGNGRERLFAGIGGAGLDAEAARLAGSRFRRLPRIWRYLAGALAAFCRFQPFEFEGQFDDQTYQGRAFLAVVANTPAYGGGIRIAPAAKMDDGWLDAAIIAELDWRRVIQALPSIARSGDIGSLHPLRYRARHVRLASVRPIPFHGDGDLLGVTPVEFDVLPAALRMVCFSARSPEPDLRRQ
ncbi:MAG TPA: diacylglycerol kinase family protein [Candidatus Acidoferrales bacterium]|nr:diacylglycerol kinase family protein [Candidatus Acidoferrales bacterium]